LLIKFLSNPDKPERFQCNIKYLFIKICQEKY